MVHLRMKNLETLMKSRNEFTTKEEYNEYLRTYFTGLAMQGLLNNTAFTVKFIASKSVQIAEELLKQLENSNTKNQDDRN